MSVENAQAQIKAVFDDGFAEINGREYLFEKMNHKGRRKVFAYMSSIGPAITAGDFSFLDSNEFVPVERVISEYVSFDGMTLDKLKNHWDQYPQDYLTLTVTALGVISYPFTQGGSGS